MQAFEKPEVWITILVLVTAIVALATQVLKFCSEVGKLKEQRRCAPVIIFHGVESALAAALRAQGPDVLNAARRLITAVRAYLGPVLDLIEGGKSALDALDKALKGKVKVVDPAAPPAGGPQVLLVPAVAAGASAEAISTPSVSVATATAEGGAGYHVVVTSPPPGAITPTADAKPKERDATTEEHVQAVRLAIEAFALYWERAGIELKLRRAQEALLISAAIRPEDCGEERTFGNTTCPNPPAGSGGFSLRRR